MAERGAEMSAAERRRFLAPLALAQFICGFAGSNMNVMINDITGDLDTTVAGVQATITLFLLTMAILMIPCGKLTDRWGRNSLLEGVGTALLIPPVYILTTLAFRDLTSRAKAFGVISGMGGIGATAGPLIGGVITSAIRTTSP
jgi:MFS family permease